MTDLTDLEAYASWASDHDRLTEADRTAIRRGFAVPVGPVFSVVIPAPAGGAGMAATRVVESVCTQLCPQWELLAPQTLCLTAGPQAVVVPDDADQIAFCNKSVVMARGEFIVFLPPDTLLAEHAVAELSFAARQCPDAAVIYADEDTIDSAGRRRSPRFKTAWDAELILACNVPGAAFAVKTDLLIELGGLRRASSVEMALYDLVLRIAATVPPDRMRHVPAVLFHRLFSDIRTWDAEAARAIVRRHLADAGLSDVLVAPSPLLPACNWIRRPVPSPAPLVSIVIPTRDRPDLLRQCVESVLHETRYRPFEIIIVDNDSCETETIALLQALTENPGVRVLRQPGAFNYSALNNYAVRQAGGDVVVMLNNDTKVIVDHWLDEMVAHALRPEVGAVGAKLLYADGRVQHCGITLGPGLALAHQLRLSDRLDPGPAGELALTRTVLAVTGACMAFRKAVFEEVGGLDATTLPVAYSDVDLCLRMGDYGYRIICTPFAELFHFESVTRGYNHSPQKQAIDRAHADALGHIWGPLLDADPFCNPNVEYRWDDAVFASPPRRPRPWAEGARA